MAVVPMTDSELRMRQQSAQMYPTSYAQGIAQQRAAGYQPTVLGASVGPTSTPTHTTNTTTPNPIDTAQTNVNTQQDALKNQINSGFNDIFSQLDAQAGLLPGYQQQDESSLLNTYGKLTGGINDSLANANKSIDLSKQQVQTGVDKSVSDIGNSLRSLLKNAQGNIGAYGAGNSSAANVQVPYAFSKMYAQQRGNIQGQANSQFVDLDKKALDVQSTYNSQKMQLDQWENDNLTGIRDKYRGMLDAINSQRANATGQQANALISLQQNILQQAQADLSNVKQEAANNRNIITQWIAQKAQSLPQLQQQLQQAGQYTTSPIQYQQMSGIQSGGQQGGYDPYSIVSTLQKKQQQTGV
jgi:hypothetical protein